MISAIGEVLVPWDLFSAYHVDSSLLLSIFSLRERSLSVQFASAVFDAESMVMAFYAAL